MQAKPGTNRRKTLRNSRKDWKFGRFARVCRPLIACVVCDAILKRRGRMTCPKASIVLEKIIQFISLSAHSAL